jgi:hypothetical protein
MVAEAVAGLVDFFQELGLRYRLAPQAEKTGLGAKFFQLLQHKGRYAGSGPIIEA